MSPPPEVPLRTGDIPNPRAGVSVTLDPETHQKLADTLNTLSTYIYVQFTKCRNE